MGEPGGLSSVRNAARVLKAFTSNHRLYGVSELARRLELSTSSVHRLLTTLESEHLIEQDEATGKYRLGLAIFDLTAAVAPGYDLSDALLPPMTVLRNRTGDTVQVAVLDGRQVVYIERLDSPHTLRMFLGVGRRNWAHCTSTGKVLLAHLPGTELEMLLEGWDLPVITGQTITDVELLKKELAQVKDLGYAQNNGESEADTLSVGAPIRDATGRVIAAMSVAGPRARMDAEIAALRFAVMEAAGAASMRLGHHSRRAVR
ncbi:MAG TPA: IclR family transcriptional regulator [Acidimicrobiia bacterium]|nr:IclR family transcriptional regulator [Acidimicrobiia bacterium]